MLELTVSEILEESRKVKNSAGNLPVRYLPVEVVRKAKEVIEKGDFLGAAKVY